MNIYSLLQKLPTNGYMTAIGGIGGILYGIGGIITGQMDQQLAFAAILAGWTALGIGNKFDKFLKASK